MWILLWLLVVEFRFPVVFAALFLNLVILVCLLIWIGWFVDLFVCFGVLAWCCLVSLPLCLRFVWLFRFVFVGLLLFCDWLFELVGVLVLIVVGFDCLWLCGFQSFWRLLIISLNLWVYFVIWWLDARCLRCTLMLARFTCCGDLF